MRKFKKILIYSLITILILGIGYGITFYFSFFQGTCTVENGKAVNKYINQSKLEAYSKYNRGFKVSTNEINKTVSEVKGINLKFIGKPMPKDYIILEKGYRYYLPLDYIFKTLGYKVEDTNPLKITKGKKEILLNNDSALINGKEYKFRGELLNKDSKNYLSLSDIEYIFSLTAVFNKEKNSIDILNSHLDKINYKDKVKNGRAALIRFEDFTAGGSLLTDENQSKMKGMFDYLYKNNIRFNIAWVPHYKNPKDNYDNNLLTNKDLNNIFFINLLDYAINSNAEIGLHGYTHQANDSISTVGSELTSKINNTEKETRAVVENAISVANKLNIPVTFFESPHYHATKKQKDIIGEYFQILYEPYSVLYYTGIETTNKGNLYIPTPLGYVHDRDPEPLIKKLDNPTPNLLASMFYHPTIELEYIDVKVKDNYFNSDLTSESILKKIVTALNEKGYSTINASEMIESK